MRKIHSDLPLNKFASDITTITLLCRNSHVALSGLKTFFPSTLSFLPEGSVQADPISPQDEWECKENIKITCIHTKLQKPAQAMQRNEKNT